MKSLAFSLIFSCESIDANSQHFILELHQDCAALKTKTKKQRNIKDGHIHRNSFFLFAKAYS